eukprot:2516762-Rhodomonas_salina.1
MVNYLRALQARMFRCRNPRRVPQNSEIFTDVNSLVIQERIARMLRVEPVPGPFESMSRE